MLKTKPLFISQHAKIKNDKKCKGFPLSFCQNDFGMLERRCNPVQALKKWAHMAWKAKQSLEDMCASSWKWAKAQIA